MDVLEAAQFYLCVIVPKSLKHINHSILLGYEELKLNISKESKRLYLVALQPLSLLICQSPQLLQ